MTATAISEPKITGRDGWEFAVNSGECEEALLKVVEVVVTEGIPDDWARLSSARHSSVFKFEHGGRAYVFKEYAVRGVIDSLKAKLKGSRALRAWNGSLMIEKCGLKAPVLIMRGEKKSGRGKGRSFIVTGYLENACGIYTFLTKKIKDIPQQKRASIRRNIAAAFGDEVGRLHACGVAHGDLRLDNIMVEKWDSPRPEFYFIDNERNETYAKVPYKALRKNLVAVSMMSGLPSKDRIKFFVKYLERMPELKKLRKELVLEIGEKARARVMKKHGRDIFGIW